VIAVAPFADLTNCSGGWKRVALRNRVVAELVQKYNCIVLSRTKGIALKTERVITSLKQIDSKEDFTSLPAADFSIVGFFDIARRSKNSNQQLDLGCTLLITDLNNLNANYQKIDFIPNDNQLYIDDVVKKIAQALKLKPKPKDNVNKINTETIDETWAVMPLSDYRKTKKFWIYPPDTHTSEILELAIQNSGEIKNIVDHTQINKILKELNISLISQGNEGVAGKIACIVGADKIIFGSIGKAKKNTENLRIDILLVDAKTGVILDAATVYGTEKEKIRANAARAVLAFTKRKYTSPKLADSSPEALKKECEIYCKVLKSLGSGKGNDIIKLFTGIAYAESIFLLARGDKKILKSIMLSSLYYCLFGYEIIGYPFVGEVNIRRLLNLLEGIENLVQDKEVLFLIKIKILYCMIYLPDKRDEAIILGNNLIEDYPEKSLYLNYLHYLIGITFYRKGNIDKAIEFLKKAIEEHSCIASSTLAQIDLMNQKLESEKDQLNNLNKVYFINEHHELILRKIQLLHKLHGAKKTMHYLNTLSTWNRTRPEIQFEFAKVYADMGRKEDAALLLKDLDTPHSLKLMKIIKNPQKKKDFVADVKALKKILGTNTGTFKKLREIIEIPQKYKVYILPMGNPDIQMINNAQPLIEDFLGVEVVVLPLVPLPDDSYCYNRSRNQYDVVHVLERLYNAYKIPDDAIAFNVVTEKSIYEGKYKFVNSESNHGIRMISYNMWYSPSPTKQMQMLAKEISSAFMLPFIYGCPVTTCINTSTDTAASSKHTRFACCPLCQKKLKKHTGENFYTKFRSQFNLYPTDADPRWRDAKMESAYKEKLENTFSVAKAKAEKVTKNSNNYQKALSVDNLNHGLKYKYYDLNPGTAKSTEDLKILSPKDYGINDTLNLIKSKKNTSCGLEFEGYIKIPLDGSYQFYLSSACGSRLFINENEVIQNDGPHQPKTKSANLALQAGVHSIKLTYFNDDKTPALLHLYYRGPKTLGQEIPANVLFHKK